MLKRMRIEGSWIEQQTLFELRRSLQTIHAIVAFLRRDDEKAPRYPELRALTENVVVYPDMIKKIDGILDAFGQIRDNASKELADIRRQLSSTMGSISKTLNAILRNAQSEGLVEKDVSPSMRDGRLVIPVNPAFKRKIKGIVHDESASGKTVYIEPSEVVEANNRIRELESEERREIIRILTEFANYLRPFLPDLAVSYDFLAEIDYIRAEARFALQNQCHQASIGKQAFDGLGTSRPSVALSVVSETKSKSRSARYHPRRNKSDFDYFGSQCRRQIGLSQNCRIAPVYGAMRLVDSSERKFAGRYFSRHLYRYRRRTIYRKRPFDL